ncbi:hypothetical protein HYC85_023317 [Camellia sinensis]|uniref:Protein kinase domain-containing protein n=1 Tax=Camellia sinensis TaxID=4442 RepID=A0A7J7GI18_CAMSI|nr:hypothetical protein HYC85_023317 [Camellia sinensis]
MENPSRVLLCFLFSLLTSHLFLQVSIAQLSSSETRILFRLQQFLEYPEALEGWTNWTTFCYLSPSPSLSIVCTDNHITELTVTGNRTSPNPKSGNFLVSQQTLSDRFSIDSFFTDLTKLSSLRVLSLVSLGLWGPLPAKIERLRSLEVMNFSSNFIYGEIPSSICSLKNLKSLVLADNLFNGSVPDLTGLQALEEIDLGNNQLGPKFPSLSNNLISIIVRNNSLRSEIPSGFKDFNLLQRLDISSNVLVGPIPSPLFSLPSIQYLNLADNQFSGALPMNTSCNANLSFVDISNNFLIGKLPSCIGSNSTNRTVLSSWNCVANGDGRYQHPYSFCHKEALAVNPPIRDQGGQSTVKLGLILGLTGGSCWGHVPRSIRLPAFGLRPYQVFTLEEMEDATNNFDPSNLVGEGSHGQLYKGWLRDGSTVLVKCLKLKQKYSHQNLQQNMDVISKLRHRHLVCVLGHCTVTYQDHPNAACTVFIVLEHVANGSLRDHLKEWIKREYLKWPQRMGISIGIARGIQFLHTGIAPGLFGNDLKIENILLDESLTAKISTYNISLPFKDCKRIDPIQAMLYSSSAHSLIELELRLEYTIKLARAQLKIDECFMLTPLDFGIFRSSICSIENPEKNDVYQLGIILLEIITSKPITSDRESHELKLQLERTLAESPSKLQEAIDPSIRGTFAYESLKTVVEITMKCLCEDSSTRPTIEDVLWHLQYSIQVQDGWNSSGNLSEKM